MLSNLHPLLEMVVYATAGLTLATPFLLANLRIAPSVGLVDWPKARGVSEEQIPIVGLSVVFLSLVVMGLLSHLYGGISSWFLITSAFMGLMGYFDDRQPLSAVEKLFWQLICGGLILFFDPLLYSTITLQYGALGTFLAIFFLLGLVNAINFIDGIDGLAGSMVLIGSIGAALFARHITDLYSFFVLACIIVGMLLPFLYLNLQRRGFLGNTGSYFLGYTLAYLHLATPVNAESILSKLSLSGLCFVVPIADAIVVIASRTLTIRSPFMADKGHLHHRMVQTSIALRYVLMNFGIISVAGLAIAFVLNETPAIRYSQAPFVICFSHIGITGILILLMEKASKRRVQSYVERLDVGEPLHYLKFSIRSEKGELVSRQRLKRLEALVSAEIRVTDVCFTKEPEELLVVLKSYYEPVRFMSARLAPIFKKEGLDASLVSETGEFVKVCKSRNAAFDTDVDSETPPAEPPVEQQVPPLKKAL